MTPTLTILQGDSLATLRTLPAESVHCVVTSPPYWGLRMYLPDGHPDKTNEIGLEPTPDEWCARLVEVFREVRRVLHPSGVLFLNVGDSYASTAKGNGGHSEKQDTNTGSWFDGRRINGVPPGLKQKDLVGQPWLLAFALRADGWWLRQEIIWEKPNPMPESVTDRCTKSHEQIFLLAKRERYFFDATAIAEPCDPETWHNSDFRRERNKEIHPGNGERNARSCTRNKRTVWTIPTEPYDGAHFATFATALVKPCILAGTSARGVCPKCGEPWAREVEKTPSTMNIRVRDNKKGIIAEKSGVLGQYGASDEEIENYGPEESGSSKTIGWSPGCTCEAGPPIPATVLDPFGGVMTTACVALELGRSSISIELNPNYIELGRRRLAAVTPGLALA